MREEYSFDWDSLRNSPAGTFYRANRAGEKAMAGGYNGDSYNDLVRSFFYFDLSTIPATADIVSVRLNIAGYVDDDGDLCVMAGTQADTLSNADYQKFTGEYFAKTDWVAGPTSPYPQNTFDFNAAGLAYIKSKFSYTAKLCIREYDHDYKDVPIPDGVDCESGGCYANIATAIDRPKLTVTYLA